MPKGYWVVSGEVTDPEGYRAYVAENANAFSNYGVRFLARGGKSRRLSRAEAIAAQSSSSLRTSTRPWPAITRLNM